MKNDAVSVGGGEVGWKDEYKVGESTLIPIPCGCVVVYDKGGGEPVDVGKKTVVGSDGQRVCIVVVSVPLCGITAASLPLCRRRYCLHRK